MLVAYLASFRCNTGSLNTAVSYTVVLTAPAHNGIRNISSLTRIGYVAVDSGGWLMRTYTRGIVNPTSKQSK